MPTFAPSVRASDLPAQTGRRPSARTLQLFLTVALAVGFAVAAPELESRLDVAGRLAPAPAAEVPGEPVHAVPAVLPRGEAVWAAPATITADEAHDAHAAE